jgi:hypothetical protein
VKTKRKAKKPAKKRTAKKSVAKKPTTKKRVKKVVARKPAKKVVARKPIAKGSVAKSALGRALRALIAAPPVGKRAGATDFAALEELIALPETARALWSWSNGCERLLCRSQQFQIFDDLYSVEQAARTLEMNRDAEMEETLLPIGGEPGSGDCLVLDVETGAVSYWDHEEGAVEAEPVAKSLEELLARSVR